MVSDVDETIEKTKHTPPELPLNSSSPKNLPNGNNAPEVEPKIYQQAPLKPAGLANGIKWVLGIVGAILFLAWIGSLTDKSATDASNYQPTAESAPTVDSSQSTTSSRPYEEMPPYGTNLVLNTNQIHYCLAENIRLEASKDTANNNIESDVTSFNANVADYNKRCGEYRYLQSDLYNATSDIEPYRSVIEAEGRSRFTVSAPEYAPHIQPITTSENTYLAEAEPEVQDTELENENTDLTQHASVESGSDSSTTSAY